MSSTTINPSLYSGQYYQIPTSSDSGGSSTGSSTTADPQDAVTQSLLSALSSSSSTPSLANDLVDLSPEAQSYLNGMTGSSTSTSLASMLPSSSVNDISGLTSLDDSAGSGSTSNSLTNGTGFLLSPQQQQEITTILQKYQNAPFTQATYNQIQSDLKAAGLSPDQLSLEDELRGFDPTQMLINDLNGTASTSDMINFGNNPTEQSNANSYMQQIFTEWQNMSTTAGNASTTATNSTASGSGTPTTNLSA